jgi:hypothetical protein
MGGGRRPQGFSVERAPNNRDVAKPAHGRPVPAALCGRLLAWVPLLCRGLRLGVQGEEAHHVAGDREPQQMDAGLDLAAQR